MTTSQQPAMWHNLPNSVAAETSERDAAIDTTYVESTHSIVEVSRSTSNKLVDTTAPTITIKGLLADATDVSGKGLPAAFLMAMTRIVLQGAARFMPTVHPRAILSRLNEELYDDFTDLGMFATVFVGCYDSTSRNLAYANAGHSPVIYCPAGGTATLLEADGPAVGVLPINLCENMSMPFHPDDVLVVATDGFCEAMNADGEMFGYESLLKAVEELVHLPAAAAIAEELYKRIHFFSSGEEQSDDQTLIIIKGDN